VSQLIVRNLDEDIVRRLKERASRHGRSAEAEHREILREALRSRDPRKDLKALLLEMPAAGSDADFRRRRDRGRRIRL